MNSIKWLFENWWCQSGLLLTYGWQVALMLYGLWLIFSSTYLAWNSQDELWTRKQGIYSKDDYPPIILSLIFRGMWIILILMVLLPLMITIIPCICFGWLYFKFIIKWSKNYQKIKKQQDDYRLSALERLIESDPLIKNAYENLMKDSHDSSND